MASENSNPFHIEEENLDGKNPFDDDHDATGDFEDDNDGIHSNIIDDDINSSFHHDPTLQV